ncbi:FAD-binding oxidoreductase [Streptomyces sp. NBC_00006]|uniref:NAD(P)/FAD-dependent oxidoreductase n=1 Tax=Streptomyces sp. NBC_00006 TaxID=2975619 RepID=UPI002254A454|nr:FAD-dependent oxidoreductase [Streptomyces sp. NBC_00006]MCX5529750.1 FAD-binding oxidoreductase [Streptomyces sp. NBC_00006]
MGATVTYDSTVAAGVGWDTVDVARDWAGLPPLKGDVTAGACVVGLGGSGLAAVDALLDRGLSVVGLDAGRVAAGAAGRNGGILSGGGAMSLASEANGVPRAVRIALHHDSDAELRRLEAQLGPAVVERAPLYRIAGFVRGPRDDAERAVEAEQLAALRADAAVMREAGIPVEDYEGVLGRGLVLPNRARINPAVRALKLADHCLKRGARLYENSHVTGIESGAVHTGQGTVRARVVLVAVDGKLDAILPQLSDAVHSVRLQMLATEPLSRRILDGPLGCRDGFEWMQQDADGRLLIGGGRDQYESAEYTLDDHPTAPVQRWIDQQAERAAGEPVRVTHRWAASVGYTSDQRALCLPVHDGVMAVGGYSGSGNLVGPLAARTAVGRLLDGADIPGYFRARV